MNVFTLSWRYLWSRPMATVLNLLLLALGLASMAFVLIARDQVDRAFE
ncbi:MAG: ABC transporter permease, partial [Hydrogenophaga sp.]|nr:ABC transporter permease [Hydrogenophaga sp.]